MSLLPFCSISCVFVVVVVARFVVVFCVVV